ncbi:conserved protein of unknown function [Burkholderia multivorans]
MNASHSTNVSRAIPVSWPNAFSAFGPLAPVISALACEHGMSRPAALIVALVKIAVASQGAAYVRDERNRKIALKFNVVLLAPTTTGNEIAQYVASPLAEIEGELASQHTRKAAAYQVACLAALEQRKTLEAELKVAATNAARFSVLLMHHAGHAEKEPHVADFLDAADKFATRDKRIDDLANARAQAKADGNSDLAKVLGAQLKTVRREEVLDFDTAYARWQVRSDSLTVELAQLDGAFEREAHVRLELAELVANAPKKPIVPKLVYRNTPLPAVIKVLGQSQSATSLIITGDATLKTMRKQGDYLIDLLDSCPTIGTVGAATSLFGTTAPTAAIRDSKLFTADDAAWLSLIHFVRDSPQQDSPFDGQPFDADALPKFDDMLKVILRQSHDDGFSMQEINLSSDAAKLKLSACEALRALRANRALHPILDAYLARMSITMIVIAALLYLARGEAGLLSVATMQDAIAICQWLAEEFEHAVVPAPEPPPALANAWTLRNALYHHVGKTLQTGREHPFRIAMSTLCGKSSSIGLTKPQIRNAAHEMVRQGWANIKPDGLDLVIDLNPAIFGLRYHQ